MTRKNDNDNHEYYQGDSHIMKREFGKTPNGNEFDGKWVLRDMEGNFIGHDRYRNDLAERHDLSLRDNTVY